MVDFLSIPADKLHYQYEHFFIIEDGFPVSPSHLLIVSNLVTMDYFHLLKEEQHSLVDTVEIAKSLILSKYKPDGFNIGMNCGEATGQTVFHFHCHVIPRYYGDMEKPLERVRYCIPEKGVY
jgi:diadenosine tetraphosphate (Ap4A) HIT family hydrolase